jgi:hypothetical protein
VNRVAWLVALAVGAAVGGVFGALVVLVALVASRRSGPQVLWGAAVVLMVLAAVATLLQGSPATIDPDYATRRPLANASAMASLLVAGVAIAQTAHREPEQRR